MLSVLLVKLSTEKIQSQYRVVERKIYPLAYLVFQLVYSLNFFRTVGSFDSLNHSQQLILKLRFRFGSTQLDGFYGQLFLTVLFETSSIS